jgi:predicted RNA-binding protein with TRAM domain
MAWRVTFSEPVTGVTGDDFVLALTGVTASPRLSVGGSGATYTVTAARVAGLGTIGLNLVDDGTIRDLAGNPLVPDVASASLTSLTPVRAGVDPRTLAVGDLDGDGILDIAVANLANSYSFKEVTILFGKGDGTFRPLASASVDSRPVAVAIGDLNVDGRADIVSTGGSDGTAGVLAGNGQFGFRALRPAATGENPSSLAIGDVNGDGRLDVLVPNYSDKTVSILVGRGDGTFEPQRTVGVGTHPSAIALGDVNGDGKSDLVLSNLSDDTVSVLLGKGDGTFAGQQTFAVGNLPSSVALGDLNGDGRLDLAVANLTSNTVSVLMGMGDGTFQTQQTVATGVFPQSVTLGDINGDGRLDLVVANSEDDTVGVLVGKGDGTFEPQQTFATGDSPLAAVVGDLNGDGRADVVTIDYSSYTASVLLNAARGNFTGEVAAHLRSAKTPEFGLPTRTQTSFTIGITNYAPAFSWGIAVTAGGGEATLSETGVITVTGVAPGDATTLRVTTTRSGFGDGASTVTVRTLRAPHVPTFGTPVSGSDGFSVRIANYDHRFTWAGTAAGGGRVRISAVGVLTVTGVTPGTPVAVTITATRAGYAPGSSAVEATTLQPAAVPMLGPVTRSRFSASFQIVNFDPAYAWTVGAGPRVTASISRTGRVMVLGIPSAESLVTMIMSTRAGHAMGSAGIRVPAFSAART